MTFGPHRKRFEGRNHGRFITCSCFRRQKFLDRDRTRQWFVEAIELSRERHRFDLWAWVIMPEHFHLLIFPEPDGATMRAILSTLKQSVAKRALGWVRVNRPESLGQFSWTRSDGSVGHRFWQKGGGYDRNLWSADEVWEKIDYIHMNPVKRGLCDRPEEWNWSSARTFVDLESGALSIDRVRIPSRVK